LFPGRPQANEKTPVNIRRLRRNFKPRARPSALPPARQRVDPDFLRRAIRAHFIVEEAQRHGVFFAIENGKLAVEYPLSVELRFSRQLQEAILENKQTIATYIYSRERGVL
jgi:hypothetical protein